MRRNGEGRQALLMQVSDARPLHVDDAGIGWIENQAGYFQPISREIVSEWLDHGELEDYGVSTYVRKGEAR